MTHYSFSLPTRLYFGPGVFKNVGIEVNRIGKRAFVLIDPFLRNSYLEEHLDHQMIEASVKTSKWYDIVPNPRADTCDSAAKQAQLFGSDVIVAIGGGSTIDTAKAVAMVAVHGGNAWDYTARAGVKHLDPTTPGLPIIAVPSSAGTGAEVTPFAVLSRPDLKMKATIKNLGCAPTVAIVDPEIHISKPKRLTAGTGIDTFLHALEGFLGNQANGWTDTVGLRSIQLFARHFKSACHDGSNITARTGMAEACYLAGLSLANVGVGIPHSLGQALGALKDAPHGEACAAFLIPTLRWTLPEGTDRLAKIASILEPKLNSVSITEQAKALPGLIEKLFIDVGLPLNARELGLTISDTDELIDIAYANYWRGIERWIKSSSKLDIVELVKASL